MERAIEDCPLTARQRRVVRVLAEGWKPLAAARRLGIAYGTYSAHIQQIAERYGLEPNPERTVRTQIVIEAYRRGDLKGG